MDFEWLVADEFGILSGLDKQERLPYLPLCISAAQQIKARLRQGISLADHMRPLCTAAAAVAFYRYILLRTSLDEGAFTAGDLTVGQNTAAVPAAKQLRDESLRAVSFLLEDTSFVFRQVK